MSLKLIKLNERTYVFLDKSAIFRTFTNRENDYQLRHICVYAWGKSAPEGWILIKFNVGVFYQHLSVRFNSH